MSDVLPKFKMYMFVSFIAIVITLGFNLMVCAYTNSFDILLILSGFLLPLIPLAEGITLFALSFSYPSVPAEVFAFVGIINIIIGIVQAFILAMFILQVVHNILWNPDV